MQGTSTFVAGLLTIGNLFGQKPAAKPYIVDWSVKPSTAITLPAKPAVVCGMTLIPADSKIDPKIRVARNDNGVKYAMGVVQPTGCTRPQR